MTGSATDRLRQYEALLRAWAPRLDLMAPGDLPRLRERHLDDSLRLLPLLDEVPAGACLDVGSGAGLPGIPLAIQVPERKWVLLEPRRKRAAFLEEVVRSLELDCEVRAEDSAQALGDLAGQMALVTARALAPPAEAIRICLPFARPGGVVAIFVGHRTALPSAAEEWSDGIAIVRSGPLPPDRTA